jgi:hypothetical protein
MANLLKAGMFERGVLTEVKISDEGTYPLDIAGTLQGTVSYVQTPPTLILDNKQPCGHQLLVMYSCTCAQRATHGMCKE